MSLSRPEQRLLADFDVFFRVQRDIHQPAVIVGAAHLREGEDDLVLEIVVLHFGIQILEELRIFGRPTLPDPEDRLLPQIDVGITPRREIPQNCARAGTAMLRQREDRFFLDLGSGLGIAQNRIERGNGFISRHLREPEHRLLAHFLIGIVADNVEQNSRRLVGALLRQEEHRLAAEAR